MKLSEYTSKLFLNDAVLRGSFSLNSLGQNPGVSSLSLLQGIFPTQGLNPGLPLCKQILYQLSHKVNPRILEWVAYPFLQQIFLTQESNWGLLHCRWIQGSPISH